MNHKCQTTGKFVDSIVLVTIYAFIYTANIVLENNSSGNKTNDNVCFQIMSVWTICMLGS